MKILYWYNIVQGCAVMMSLPLMGCPTCLGSKDTMNGKSQLYRVLRGMNIQQQKQLVRLVEKLNHRR